MSDLGIKIDETVRFVKTRIKNLPQIGIILGSGLGLLVPEIKNRITIPYDEIPHFPVSTVEGHAGQLVFGDLEGKDVVAMQGRFHYYEGYSPKEVIYPVWVMKKLGVEILIVTNAAGGINLNFSAGDLVIINDHINLTGTNPLIGPNIDELGPRFPDMSEAYDSELRQLAKTVGDKRGINTKEGIYGQLTGPSYETPSEIRYLRTIGVDQVGMSTGWETIIANHCGIRVLGISCITNMAAGVLPQKLNHAEVMETADRVRDQFITLVKGIVQEVGL